MNNYTKGVARISKFNGTLKEGKWIPSGDCLESIEKENGVTVLGVGSLFQRRDYAGYIYRHNQWFSNSGYELYAYVSEIFSKAPCIGSAPTAGNDGNVTFSSQGWDAKGEFIDFNYVAQQDDSVLINIKYRFSPDTNRSRNIRTIGIKGFTTLSLDQVFVQESNQVLDVDYSITIESPSLSNNDFSRAERMFRLHSVIPAASNDKDQSPYYPSDMMIVPWNNSSQNMISGLDYGMLRSQEDLFFQDNAVYLYYGSKASDEERGDFINMMDGVLKPSTLSSLSSLEEYSGIPIGSLAYGNYTSSNISYDQYDRSDHKGSFRSTSMAPITHLSPVLDPSSNSAIQNTFPRTAASNLPYQDVDNLATGSGSIVLEDDDLNGGSSWTRNELEMPFKYRVEIKEGGETGVATYNLKVREWTGTEGNDFRFRTSYPLKFMNVDVSTGLNVTRVGTGGSGLPLANDGSFNNPSLAQHGQKWNSSRYMKDDYDYKSWEDNTLAAFTAGYKFPEFITWDRTGVTINNINKLSFNIDENSGTVIGDCCQVISNTKDASIYIADLQNGLYKVSRSFGSSSSEFSVTRIQVPNAANDTVCRGVQQKEDNTLWAIFDEELCSSSDHGSTWTVYNALTPTQFKLNGVLDTNSFETEPTRVAGFCMDRYNPEDRFVFPIRSAGNTGGDDGSETTAWWSREGSSSGESDWSTTTTKNVDCCAFLSAATRFYCSPRGLFIVSPGNDNSYVNAAKFKGSWGYQGFSGVNYSSLMEGSYGALWWKDSDNSSEYWLGAYNNQQDLKRFIACDANAFDPDSATADFSLILSEGETSWTRGSGHYLNRGNTKIIDENDDRTSPAYILKSGLGLGIYSHRTPYVSTLGGSRGDTDQLKSMGAWQSYGWNGSSWVEGDSSGRPTHTTSESLIDGLTIKFEDGQNTPSFIQGEYYDTYVYNGIFKDNATSLNLRSTLTLFDIEKDETLNKVVPSSDLGTVTEDLYMKGMRAEVSGATGYKWVEPGSFVLSDANFGGSNFVALGEQKLEGDFEISFKIADAVRSSSSRPTGDLCFGLRNYIQHFPENFYDVYDYTPSNENISFRELIEVGGKQETDSPIKQIFRLVSTPWSSAPVVTTKEIDNFLGQTEFKISRTNDIISYYFDNVLWHTSTVQFSGPMQFVIRMESVSSLHIYDGSVTYTHTNEGRYVDLSNGVDTGKSDPNFRKVVSNSRIREGNNQIFIDGTPALIKYDNSTPTPGEPTMLPFSGRLWFHENDAGKTITGKYGYLKKLIPV